MKRRIHIWLRQCRSRFLGRFAEVRTLRKLEMEMGQNLRKAAAQELEAVKAADGAFRARDRAELELKETKIALEVMTQGRLQADRSVEIIRGELKGLKEATDREITSMKQMVDWFGLEGRGRQVFGMAPLQGMSKEQGETIQPAGAIQARRAVQQLTADFLKEAETRLAKHEPLEGSGPEFSSTSHAVQG